MKITFTAKDIVLIAIFFILTLIASSLFLFLDETALESRQPPQILVPSAIGFAMSMPLVPVTLAATWLAGAMGASVTVTSHIGLIPWFTAIAYSTILAFVLAKINAKRVK